MLLKALEWQHCKEAFKGDSEISGGIFARADECVLDRHGVIDKWLERLFVDEETPERVLSVWNARESVMASRRAAFK